jgi:uncharacterized RDD family membrane protein YckC
VWDAEEETLEDDGSQPEDAAAGATSTLNWREELKERLSQHSTRKKLDSDLGSAEAPRMVKRAAVEPPPEDEEKADQPQDTEPRLDLSWLNTPDPAEGTVKESPLDEPIQSRGPAGPARAPYTRPGLKLSEAPGDPLIAPLLKRPASGRQPLANPVRSKGIGEGNDSPQVPLEVPLRRPVGAGRPLESLRPRPLPPSAVAGSAASPQKLLDLEPPAEPPTAPPPESLSPPVEPLVPASREILVSRALCGVIDLTMAAVLGVVFVGIASRLVGFDFFNSLSLLFTAGFSIAFHLLSSLFFLITCGQTPGMAATRLRLEAEDPEEGLHLKLLILRTILFLPCLTSVVGMAWAFFDPYRRCAHDVLSRTLVVEAE